MTDKDDMQQQVNDPEGTPAVTETSPARRKLLKTLAGAGGVVAAGALLPEKWTQPVVDRILVPAHAQATGISGTYSETLGYDIAANSVAVIPDQSFQFPLGGVTPAGGGTVTISNFQGDIDSDSERWTIWLGPVGSGINLGLTNNSTQCGPPAPESVFPVSQAQLQAAISGGSIEISASQSGTSINAFCENNTMDVTLTFPF